MAIDLDSIRADALRVGMSSSSASRFRVVVVGNVNHPVPRILRRSDSIQVARGHAQRFQDAHSGHRSFIIDSVDAEVVR